MNKFLFGKPCTTYVVQQTPLGDTHIDRNFACVWVMGCDGTPLK